MSLATAGVPLGFGGVAASACGPLVVLFGGRRVLGTCTTLLVTTVGLLSLLELEEGALAASAAAAKASTIAFCSEGLASLVGRGVSDLAALTTGKVAPVSRPGVPGFGLLDALPLCFGLAELEA